MSIKNIILTIFLVVGLVLILAGDLRMMLLGVFLILDALGAQVYFGFQTLDGRVSGAIDHLGDSLQARIVSIEGSLASIAGLEDRVKRICEILGIPNRRYAPEVEEVAELLGGLEWLYRRDSLAAKVDQICDELAEINRNQVLTTSALRALLEKNGWTQVK
jgi:hypothetical protein